MNGLLFGKELKALRVKAGIGSKELSRKVGKAVTYVSQLERGLIKNPDYHACYKLLQAVGIAQDEIEVYLEKFNIYSPEREQFQLDWAVENFYNEQKQIEKNPNAYIERWHDWYEQNETAKLKSATESLQKMLNVFIDKDLTRASTVIQNIEKILSSKENFEFLCQIFENDLSAIVLEDRDSFLNQIKNSYLQSSRRKEL